MSQTVTVRLNHNSSISGAIWCEPVGWEPHNELEGAEFSEGSWWSDEEEEAGLVWFGVGDEGEVIEADLDDLRVAACGNCRVVDKVRL